MVDVILQGIEGLAEGATVSRWCYEEGDFVEEGEDLVEVSMEAEAGYTVPAPVSGTLTEIYFEEGEYAEVGEVLAIIDDE